MTASIIEKAATYGIRCYVTDNIYKTIRVGIPLKKTSYIRKVKPSCMGGAERYSIFQRCIPIWSTYLRCQYGEFGFLTVIESSEIDMALEYLRNDAYAIQDRMMLRAELIRDNEICDEFVALNEVAITKGSYARIINLRAYINGDFVNFYPADGILVSSPTGSTAYSLSAGGPVVNPNMECLLLTPICPHVLNIRSIVTNAADEIKILVDDDNRDILLTVDGQEGVTLERGDEVVVRKDEKRAQFIKIGDRSFFDIMRNKLTERLS